MAYKSNLVAMRASWLKRCLKIEWGWERKGWKPEDVRKVYQIYKDCMDDKVGLARHSVGARVCQIWRGLRRKQRVTTKLVYAMVGSYRNYLKAIEDGKYVEPKDC